MNNPNKLLTKETLSKKVLAAIGGLGLLGAGFLAGDKMQSEVPANQNNDLTPTEVATTAPTPEETLERAGIRIADKTPTPSSPTQAPIETLTPSVTPTVEETQVAFPTIAPVDAEQAIPTSVVFSGSADEVAQPATVPTETPLAAYDTQPTIAPIENAPTVDSSEGIDDGEPIIEPSATEPAIIGPDGVLESGDLS